jgi:hypothetical protein
LRIWQVGGSISASLTLTPKIAENTQAGAHLQQEGATWKSCAPLLVSGTESTVILMFFPPSSSTGVSPSLHNDFPGKSQPRDRWPLSFFERRDVRLGRRILAHLKRWQRIDGIQYRTCTQTKTPPAGT